MTAMRRPMGDSRDDIWDDIRDDPWLPDAELREAPRRLTAAERRQALGEEGGRWGSPKLNEEDEA